jgi:hypothetical protein
MARKRPRRNIGYENKDGLLVPKTVPAGSGEGQQAIQKVVDILEEKIPKQALRANYDGRVSHSIKSSRDVVLRTVPVAWAIPFDEIVFSRWVINLLGLRIMSWDDIITSTSTYLPDARNIVHKDFVETSTAPWLVMLDSDVLPPPDFLGRLLEHTENEEVRMVGGWYRKKGEPYDPVVYKYENYDDVKGHLYSTITHPGKGLTEVDGAGAGCWLMSREVAEALGPRPYNMDEGGEDLLLCRKVKDLGYKLWIDWDIACAHTGVAIV